MNQKAPGNSTKLISGHVMILVSIFVLCMSVSCKLTKKNNDDTYQAAKPQEVSWNILFFPGTDQTARDRIINRVQDYITGYYVHYDKKEGKDFKPNFTKIACCPCDTLLCNITFSPIDGAGKSVSSPPPTKPGPGGSGVFLGAIVSNNIPIDESVVEEDSIKNHQGIVKIKNIPVDPSKILAIIDSGIDTTLFEDRIKKLIWKDPFMPTLYDFIPGEFTFGLSDLTPQRHGSAVAGIAVKAMDNAKAYPHLMILKALDKNNRGSIFSVSCALSYARQKNATIVNLSLGYYGASEAVLRHYLQLCDSPDKPIEVFAAAGNTKHPHLPSKLCDPGSNGNLLKNPGNLFYPACFSPDFNNITSVTQIRKKDAGCFYQNYSNHFINLGIHDPLCCAIQVDFMMNNTSYYEGSSFATPVASGLKMSTLLGAGNWNGMMKFDPSQAVTVKGRYLEYSSSH